MLQNSVLLSRVTGMYSIKSFKVSRTYLKNEIVQNLALKKSHLLINVVKNNFFATNF